jgi:hypothetical protein
VVSEDHSRDYEQLLDTQKMSRSNVPVIYVHVKEGSASRKESKHAGFYRVDLDHDVPKSRMADVALDIIEMKAHIGRNAGFEFEFLRLDPSVGLSSIIRDPAHQPGSMSRRGRFVGRVSNSEAKEISRMLTPAPGEAGTQHA